MSYVSCYRNNRIFGFCPDRQPDHVFLFEVPEGSPLPDGKPIELGPLVTDNWLKGFKPAGDVSHHSLLFFSPASGSKPSDYAAAAIAERGWAQLLYWRGSADESSSAQYPNDQMNFISIGRNLTFALIDENGRIVRLNSLDDLDVEWDGSTLTLAGKRKRGLSVEAPRDKRWIVDIDDDRCADGELATVDLAAPAGERCGALLVECGKESDPFLRTELSFSEVKPDGDDRFNVAHQLRGRPFFGRAKVAAKCAIDARDQLVPATSAAETMRSRVEFTSDRAIDSAFCVETGQTLRLQPDRGARRGLLRLHLRMNGGSVEGGRFVPDKSPAIFVPEGTYFHAGLKGGPNPLAGHGQANRLLWGATITEFTDIQPGDHLVFAPGYPAELVKTDSNHYVSALGRKGVPSDVARLANAQGYLTTSWLNIQPGNRMRRDVAISYFTEPAKGPQFSKPAKIKPGDSGGVPRANLNLGALQENCLPVFPMVGRLPDPDALLLEAEAAPDPDASHLAEARRLIIPKTGGSKRKSAGGKARTAGNTVRGVTPQGILVDRSKDEEYLDDCEVLYFGSAEPTLLDERGVPTKKEQPEFTLRIRKPKPETRDVYLSLQLALRASDLFAVFRKPSEAARALLEPALEIQLRAFHVRVSTFLELDGGVMIVKYFKNRSLAELVDQRALGAKLWACQEHLAPGITVDELTKLAAKPEPTEPWYADFEKVWKSKDWQGILFLNVKVGEMPGIFEAMKGGMGALDKLRFHHFGFNYLPVQGADLDAPTIMRMAGAFGVMRYVSPTDPKWESQDKIPQDESSRSRKKKSRRTPEDKPSYRFTVTKLALSFANSKVRDFQCEVKAGFSKMFFDETVAGTPGSEGKPLELKGTYESRPSEGDKGTTDIFRLRLEDTKTMALTGGWLKEFVISEAEFSVISAPGAAETRSLLGITGTLNFRPEKLGKLSDFVVVNSVTLKKVGPEYIYHAKEDRRQVRFQMEGAGVDASIGEGTFPLLSLVPVRFKGIKMALGEFNFDLERLNFFPFGGFGKTFSFGIDLEFDFGSLGRLLGFKDFKLPAIFGWKHSWTGSFGGFAFGLNLPSVRRGEVNLTLFDFIGLKIDELAFEVCESQALALVMHRIRMVLFGQSWPNADTFDLALFMKRQAERKLAWMAGLKSESMPVIKYLGAGYRVKVPEKLLPDGVPHTTENVVREYAKMLAVAPGQSPCKWVEQQDNTRDGWVLVSKLELAGIFSAALAISDVQNLYGFRVQLFGLFGVDAFYRRIADGLGIYSCDVNLAEMIPPIQIGIASLTVPSVLLEVDTNGGFLLDLGYPRGADFKRSFKIEVAIFTGGGGFFFQSMSLAGVTALQLQKRTSGYRPPNLNDTSEAKYLKEYKAVRAGVAIRGGIGRSFSIGILKAEAALAFYGSMEGAIGTRGSARPKLWSIEGTMGILFTISAELNFAVLQAKAELLAYAENGFIFHRVLGYRESDNRPFHITLPVVFFVEVGLYVHIEVWVKIGCVMVKLFDLEFRATWRMELEFGGLSADPAEGGGSRFYLRERSMAVASLGNEWNKDFRPWPDKKTLALLATVIPCATARADMDAPPDDRPFFGSMLAQLASLPGRDGSFAQLAEFMVRWALEVEDPTVDVSHADIIERRKLFATDAMWSGANAQLIVDKLDELFALALAPLRPDERYKSYVGIPLWPKMTWGFESADGKYFEPVESRLMILRSGMGLSTENAMAEGLGVTAGNTKVNLFVEYLRAVTNSILDEIDRGLTHIAERETDPNAPLKRKWTEIWDMIAGTERRSDPNAATVLSIVAKDLNRTLFHGARREDLELSKHRPLGILAGQQKPAEKNVMRLLDVVFRQLGTGTEFTRLRDHKREVDRSWDGALEALQDNTGKYFSLRNDEIKPWLLRPKTLSLPSPAQRAVEDTLSIDGENVQVLRLPPPVRREIDDAPLSEISLCWIDTIDSDDGKHTRRRARVELETSDWGSALLLRCPVKIGPGTGSDPAILELGGVPQGERYYLDLLDLLPRDGHSGKDLPEGARLYFFLEEKFDETGGKVEVPKRYRLRKDGKDEWTLSRRNLTRLARPGQPALQRVPESDGFPYWADPSKPSDALRLLQMASITNSGGYFLRTASLTADKITENMTLVAVVKFQSKRGHEGKSLQLPLGTNAIHYIRPARAARDSAKHEPEVVRFYGDNHLVMSAYTPAGCLSFGMVRYLPETLNATSEMHDAVGFAASIQMVEYGITDGTKPIKCFINEEKEPHDCVPDKMTPLSPLDTLVPPEQRVAEASGDHYPRSTPVLHVDRVLESRLKPRAASHENVPPKAYYYRNTLRYASLENRGTLYQRLKTGNKLKVSAGFRDLFGNIVHRDRYPQDIELYYTDPVIPPAEWPMITFQLSAVEPAGPDSEPQVLLQACFQAFDEDAFVKGDVDFLHLANRVLKPTGDKFAAELRKKLSDKLLDAADVSVHGKTPEEREKALEQFEAGGLLLLNKLLNDVSLKRLRIFRPEAASVSARALRMMKESVAKGADRHLNRLLLEDGLAASLLRTVSADDETAKYRRRRWQEIREQLIGADDGDVTVSLLDERNAFTFEPAGGVLRAALIDLLDAVITNPSQSQIKRLPFHIERAGGDAMPEARLAPVVRVQRSDKYISPKLSEPWADDVKETKRKLVHDEVSGAQSAVALALSPIPARSGASPQRTSDEFREVAVQFRSRIGTAWKAQVGILRNRLNEHELWFIPDAMFPARLKEDATFPTGPDVPLVYATPKPLSNLQGNGDFAIPDFTKAPGGASDPGTFQGFAYATRSFNNVDHDAVGRRIFEAVETALQPTRFTGQNKADWGVLLAAKNLLARSLAKPPSIVSLYVDDANKIDPVNAERTCSDLFLRDLRNFYRTDSLVQVPMRRPKPSGLRNFYGKISADFIAPSVPKDAAPRTKPSFSDFVLTYEGDSGSGTAHPALTFSYDLPPGDEDKWRDWKASMLTGEITHAQFGQISDGNFSPGQWLELIDNELSETRTVTIVAKDSSDTLAVPSIFRRFPNDPVLEDVSTMPAPDDGPGVDLSLLSKWDWSVTFTTEKDAGNDELMLEVQYPDERPEKMVLADDPPLWPPRGILHCLLALDAATQVLTLPTLSYEHERRLLQATAKLLQMMAEFVANPKMKALSTDERDRFTLTAGTGIPWPKVTAKNDANPIVKTAYYGVYTSEKHNSLGAGEVQRLRVTSAPEDPKKRGQISLFKGKTRFRPSLALERNGNLNLKKSDSENPQGKRVTTPSLVYRCGPVRWQSDYEVRQQWQKVPLTPGPGTPLRTILQQSLEKIFGSTSPTPWLGFALRVDLKHCFSLGMIEASNPFYIFPTDLTPPKLSDATEKIMQAYGLWLLGNPQVAWSEIVRQEALQVVRSLEKRVPALHIALQVCLPKLADDKPLGRVLLEVENLVIPMPTIDFS